MMSEPFLLRRDGSATGGVESSPSLMDNGGFIKSVTSNFTPAVYSATSVDTSSLVSALPLSSELSGSWEFVVASQRASTLLASSPGAPEKASRPPEPVVLRRSSPPSARRAAGLAHQSVALLGLVSASRLHLSSRGEQERASSPAARTLGDQ